MNKGDHICVQYVGFIHHGIYCGDGIVIHYEGKQQSCKISRILLNEFSQGRSISIVEYSDCHEPDVVVERAESRLGEANYNLIFNNCEHFAWWCKTGQEISEQIRNFFVNMVGQPINGMVSAGASGAATEVVFALNVAERARMMSTLNPVRRFLINQYFIRGPVVNVPLKGLRAAQVSGTASLVSGVVSCWMVNQMYKDNSHLSDNEREARKKARDAGRNASMIGGILTTLAVIPVGGVAAITLAASIPAIFCVTAAGIAYDLSSQKQVDSSEKSS
jgi:Lecithin retinol acyltransferase